MPRILNVATAQMGPIARSESRASVVRRLIVLMRQAKAMGAEVVVYPEATLTAFFPHWFTENEAGVDAWFEREMPSVETEPLFDEARRLELGFHLGYCELDLSSGRKRRFNSSILVDSGGNIVAKYRKIHLPGHSEHRPETPFQNLEKRYFEVGDLGFGAWRLWGGVMGMLICNDRRWPEAFRVLGLQGVEMFFAATTRRCTIQPRPSMTAWASFTTSFACKPAPTRTVAGWSASPRLATKRVLT